MFNSFHHALAKIRITYVFIKSNFYKIISYQIYDNHRGRHETIREFLTSCVKVQGQQ